MKKSFYIPRLDLGDLTRSLRPVSSETNVLKRGNLLHGRFPTYAFVASTRQNASGLRRSASRRVGESRSTRFYDLPTRRLAASTETHRRTIMEHAPDIRHITQLNADQINRYRRH